MLYDRIIPPSSLSKYIDCYWVVESNDQTIHQQKIIPDGFPEIIFHYRDPYRINISGEWQVQSNMLFAGQIRNHFLLENTGSSGMIGIKFNPGALTELFGITMSDYSDMVVDLFEVLHKPFQFISELMISPIPYFEKVDLFNRFFEDLKPKEKKNALLIRKALEVMRQQNGIITIGELSSKLKASERKLERLFNTYVGLSPKFYSRIIRFNYIFQLVQKKKMNWSEVAQLGGFYDQSHFINNFQEFTGEDPSKYFFDDPTLANFFLKRSE